MGKEKFCVKKGKGNGIFLKKAQITQRKDRKDMHEKTQTKNPMFKCTVMMPEFLRETSKCIFSLEGIKCIKLLLFPVKNINLFKFYIRTKD